MDLYFEQRFVIFSSVGIITFYDVSDDKSSCEDFIVSPLIFPIEIPFAGSRGRTSSCLDRLSLLVDSRYMVDLFRICGASHHVRIFDEDFVGFDHVFDAVDIENTV